jgi:hypothetical protein
MVGMMTLEVPLPSPVHPPPPVTTNSTPWSVVVLTGNRMIRKLKKYAAEESEHLQCDVKGVEPWEFFPSLVIAKNRVKWRLL